MMTLGTTQLKKFCKLKATTTTATWRMPMTEPVWAWCSSDRCMERRDHDYIKGRGWFCPYCGKQNTEIAYDPLPTPPRPAIKEVAEKYLEENPEE